MDKTKSIELQKKRLESAEERASAGTTGFEEDRMSWIIACPPVLLSVPLGVDPSPTKTCWYDLSLGGIMLT